jgi:hypothetical protein
MGHVWTAPWQELFDDAAALVGCGHVSGLLVRHGWPLALMLCADWVPIGNTHSEMRRPMRVLPIPGTTLSALSSSCPRQFFGGVLPPTPVETYAIAGSNFGSWKCSPRTIMAQAIRAILLASATAATLIGLRPIR